MIFVINFVISFHSRLFFVTFVGSFNISFILKMLFKLQDSGSRERKLDSRGVVHLQLQKAMHFEAHQSWPWISSYY